MQKNPETTIVLIEEVSTANWGIGGETVAVRRKREKSNAFVSGN
jgi:4-oxalocrotonate tautomerase